MTRGAAPSGPGERRGPAPVGILLLAVSYYGVAKLGLAQGHLEGNVTPVWPPSGLSLAALLLFGRRLWPGITLGALAVNGLEGGLSIAVACGMAAGNTAEAYVGATLLRRFRFRPQLDGLRDVAMLAALAAGASTAISATAGVLSLLAGGVIGWDEMVTTWRVWWLGDALGTIVVAPLLLSLIRSVRSRSESMLRLALVMSAAVATTTYAFATGPNRLYFIFPVVAWAALRFAQRGAAVATAAVAVTAVMLTARDLGPFVNPDTVSSLWLLDCFLTVLAVTGLALAAMVGERDRAAADLRAAHATLEARVSEQTATLRHSEERFRLSFENAPIGMALVGADGRWLKVNRSLCDIVGYPEPLLLTKTFQDITHPEDLDADLDLVRRTLSGDIPGYSMEKRYIHATGRYVWISLSVSLVRDDHGRPAYFISQIQDISARKTDEIALQRSYERFRALLESAPDGMVIVDDGRIVLVNRQAESLFGYSRDDLLGQPLEILLPERLRAAHQGFRAEYSKHPSARPMGSSIELLARRADGSEFPVEVSLSPLPTEHGTLVTAAVRDISARKQAEARLAHQALHDALTGLPNRTLLNDRLDLALARSLRAGTGVAALFVDLDRFKLINDTRGHAAGDQLLVALAERLRAVVRPTDTVARFGGDEFVVICENTMATWEATMLGDRISEALRHPFDLAGEEVFLSVSVGIAVADNEPHRPAVPHSAEALLRDADAAMYRAKERGRGIVEFFDESMRTRAAARLGMLNALHRAIERQELRLYYQPVVELGGGELAGVEALVRWQHPERGLIGPSEFIPIAEDTGLIVPIGAWVLQEAARQWNEWRTRRPERERITVAVNLSARQLRQPDLLAVVREALTSNGMAPSALSLELTETVLMDDLELHPGTLTRLRELGVGLAIDDFGTGYSSLTYLKRFPVNTIKIDQHFVAGLGVDAFDTAIVESTVDMAHSLGLRVVAEGVETQDQVDLLRRIGCDLAQGAYFAMPQDPSAFDALYEAGSKTVRR